jgi:hypothetical protein
LRRTFAELKTRDFPVLAQTVHDRVGRADVVAYQRFMVDEILVKGSEVLVEYLIRRRGEPTSPEAESTFQGRLRDHIAGNLCHGLAKKVGYQMTADVGQQRDAVIDRSIGWLADLLTATPPGRLLVPPPDSPFDPRLHEPMANQPETGALKVAAILFPGYVVGGEPQTVAEKALVYTVQVEA